MSSRSILALLALAFLFLAPGLALAAEPTDTLYQARTIVTGQREPERLVGLAQCLEDVLVKVTGDPRLIGDRRLAPMKSQAAHFTTAVRYHDRKEGKPVRDEQGTRDRPYDLIATFDKNVIDALLASLHEKPWTAPRPKLVVFLGVHRDGQNYVLARDGATGIDQREALAAAAARRGMAATLPDQGLIDTFRLTTDRIAAGAPLRPNDVAAAAGGDLGLAGTLIWSDKALGWIADWRLDWHRRIWRWRIRGVNFDAAFRGGIEGAERIVSGHGAPR
jgi:hypothetical protein